MDREHLMDMIDEALGAAMQDHPQYVASDDLTGTPAEQLKTLRMMLDRAVEDRRG